MRYRPSLIISGLIVFALFGSLLYYYGRDNVGPSVQFSLDPQLARPGQTFALVATFVHVFTSPHSAAGPDFRVLDAQGHNVLVTSDDILTRAGRQLLDLYTVRSDDLSPAAQRDGEALRAAVQTIPGVISRALFDRIEFYGLRSSLYLQGGGCPVGLAPPSGAAGARTIEREDFVVLPATPAGTYRFIVPAHYLCGSFYNHGHDDNAAVTLRLTVTIQ